MEKKPKKIASWLLSLPMAFDNIGNSVTCEEFLNAPDNVRDEWSLPSEPSKMKELVIERYRQFPPDAVALNLGQGLKSRNDLIQEMEEDTELGQQMVQMEMLYVQRLKERILSGELTL